MAELPQGYTDYLDQLSNKLIQSTGEIKYNPQSISTLKSMLSKTMRPSYDREIDTLKSNVKTNSANIDADAAARGIGSSSWVTDAKMKQQNAANKNIRGVESDYNSALYNALLNRLNNQDELSLSAQQANANIRANALGSSMNPAWELYQQDKAAAGGGGGGRRGYGGTNLNGLGDDDTLEEFGKGAVGNNNITNYGATQYYNPTTGLRSGSSTTLKVTSPAKKPATTSTKTKQRMTGAQK